MKNTKLVIIPLLLILSDLGASCARVSFNCLTCTDGTGTNILSPGLVYALRLS